MKRLTHIPTWLYLTLLVGLGAFLRFWEIAKASIWHDEGYSMMLAPMGPIEIIHRTARDVHPPLYYEALHYWMVLFGNSEASARGLSAVCMLAVIPLAYLLVKNLWNERAARFSALFVATGPFLIRYSQEARMYGMVAFLLTAGTYFLVKAVQKNRFSWWSAYVLAITAALYTHYYTVFVIVAHWIYMIAATSKTRKTGLWNWRWWVANISIVALFAPWVPSAYAQFTRVQGSFWIPPVNARTLPNTLIQFLVDGSGGPITHLETYLIGLTFLIALVLTFVFAKRHKLPRLSLVLLSAYLFTGPLLVFLISFKRPVYIDRYFVFAAVAFYCLLGVMVAMLKTRYAILVTVLILAVFATGVQAVHVQATHNMKDIGAYVDSHIQPGDEIVSGELYTFFDYSYYNHTGQQVRLWSKNPVNGYGETSLIYDRSDEIVVNSLADLRPASGRVWVVGKTGTKDYFVKVPANWKPIGPKITTNDSAVQEYLVQ